MYKGTSISVACRASSSITSKPSSWKQRRPCSAAWVGRGALGKLPHDTALGVLEFVDQYVALLALQPRRRAHAGEYLVLDFLPHVTKSYHQIKTHRVTTFAPMRVIPHVDLVPAHWHRASEYHVFNRTLGALVFG